MIKIEKRNGIKMVNARDLHKFLEVGRDFSTWVKKRIKKYGFIENQDFVIVNNLIYPNLGNAKARVQTAINYHISLPMAETLARAEQKLDKTSEVVAFLNPDKDIIVHAIPERNEYVFGEDMVNNMFSGYEIISQFPVLGKYRIDWYIPELKLAVEYDERYHEHTGEQDRVRQLEIEKELGCRFIRYTEEKGEN